MGGHAKGYGGDDRGLRADDELIHGQIRPEIGYHIRRDQQRKGFAGEAARAVRDWAFQNTPFNLLCSYMKDSNVGSYSTAVANGMEQIDAFEEEDHALTRVYAITRAQWEQSR